MMPMMMLLNNKYKQWITAAMLKSVRQKKIFVQKLAKLEK